MLIKERDFGFENREVKTGLVVMDEILGGALRSNSTICISGLRGSGKSAFAQMLAESMAITNNCGLRIVSGHIDFDWLYARSISRLVEGCGKMVISPLQLMHEDVFTDEQNKIIKIAENRYNQLFKQGTDNDIYYETEYMLDNMDMFPRENAIFVFDGFQDVDGGDAKAQNKHFGQLKSRVTDNGMPLIITAPAEAEHIKMRADINMEIYYEDQKNVSNVNCEVEIHDTHCGISKSDYFHFDPNCMTFAEMRRKLFLR